MTGQTGQVDPRQGSVAVGFTTERLIFFSDAVVAIAITLLAFELPLPLPGAKSGATNGQLLHAVHQNFGGYLAFLISFVVIGSHWRGHHRLFRSVAQLDQVVASANMVWLFLIVITPFATRVLAGNGAFGVRFAFYASIQVATLLCFLVMCRRVRDQALLRGEPAAQAGGDAGDRPAGDSVGQPLGELRLLAVAAMFAISIPVAFVTHYAYLCWLAAPAAVRAEQRLRQFRRARDPRGSAAPEG